jgi:hypothetical protein
VSRGKDTFTTRRSRGQFSGRVRGEKEETESAGANSWNPQVSHLGPHHNAGRWVVAHLHFLPQLKAQDWKASLQPMMMDVVIPF